jgi:hypothetical protein
MEQQMPESKNGSEVIVFEMISGFFKDVPNTLFIIDQMNAQEPSDSTKTDFISNEKKRDLLNWISSYMTNYKCILSASANYQTYHYMLQKQTHNIRLHVYDGLSSVSPYSMIH